MSEWITRLIERAGYAGVALLMFLENLFPPLPSEVIMPLAGFAAGKGELHVAGVIAAGTAGAVAGALVWYAIGRTLGADRLKRWADAHGRWITLSPGDIDRVDGWFCRHQRWAVPLGHLAPAIRTLISIPAGVFAMPPAKFVVLTALGAGAWTSALAFGGYALGDRHERIERYLGPASTAIFAAIAAWYVYRVVTFRSGRAGAGNGRAGASA